MTFQLTKYSGLGCSGWLHSGLNSGRLLTAGHLHAATTNVSDFPAFVRGRASAVYARAANHVMSGYRKWCSQVEPGQPLTMTHSFQSKQGLFEFRLGNSLLLHSPHRVWKWVICLRLKVWRTADMESACILVLILQQQRHLCFGIFLWRITAGLKYIWWSYSHGSEVSGWGFTLHNFSHSDHQSISYVYTAWF